MRSDNNIFQYIGGFIGIFIILISIYWFSSSPFQSTDYQNTQDAWISSNDDIIGLFFFEFSSQGIISANKPIHVKIDFFLSAGQPIGELLPLMVVIPDSFTYPLISDPQDVTYSAGEIILLKNPDNGPFVGESDIIFHQSGTFGYLVFSKETPVYSRLLGNTFFPMIELAPYSVWFRTHILDRIFGLSLIEIGLIIVMISFKPYIQFIPKDKLPKRSRIIIYIFICLVFSSIIYLTGTSFFNITDSSGYALSVTVGVALFVGLLRYSK